MYRTSVSRLRALKVSAFHNPPSIYVCARARICIRIWTCDLSVWLILLVFVAKKMLEIHVLFGFSGSVLQNLVDCSKRWFSDYFFFEKNSFWENSLHWKWIRYENDDWFFHFKTSFWEVFYELILETATKQFIFSLLQVSFCVGNRKIPLILSSVEFFTLKD